MHILNGNQFKLTLMYLLLWLGTFDADCALSIINFLGCYVLHFWVLWTSVGSKSVMPGPCRKVKGVRFGHARRRCRTSRYSGLLLLVVFVMWIFQTRLFVYCGGLQCPSVNEPILRHSIRLRSPSCLGVESCFTWSWFVSRKVLNRRKHAINGNMQRYEVTRCKWESTPELPGIELCNPDELLLSQDAMMQVIRADQVCDQATGLSFCNSLLVKPKLRVRSKGYLTLVLPGKLGHDLLSLLQEAGPELKPKAFECVLTLRDPVVCKKFPRQVTLVNLGDEVVKPNDLPHMISQPARQTKILWLQAWKHKNVEMWNQLVTHSVKDTRQNVLQCLADLLSVQVRALDTWRFRLDDDTFTACIRLSDAHAEKLLNSKHLLIFARPFVAKGDIYSLPSDEVIIWANDVKTTSELQILVNTLNGVLGFLANRQGLGIRVSKEHVAEARSLLQSNSTPFESGQQKCGRTQAILGQGISYLHKSAAGD